MTHNLPPSKFTAGTTYGGKDDPRTPPPPQNPQWQPQQYPQPQPQGGFDPSAHTVAAQVPPPAAPYSPPAIDPYGQSGGYGSPAGYQGQRPYASPSPSYAAPQAGYRDPYAGGPLPAQAAGGGGTALTAAVLGSIAGIAHAAWPVPFLITFFDHGDMFYRYGFWKHWQNPWMVGSSAAQILLGLVMLIGAMGLMRRSSRGRATVVGSPGTELEFAL